MSAAPWARREPDESAEDWLLRVQLSTLAAAGLIRVTGNPGRTAREAS